MSNPLAFNLIRDTLINPDNVVCSLGDIIQNGCAETHLQRITRIYRQQNIDYKPLPILKKIVKKQKYFTGLSSFNLNEDLCNRFGYWHINDDLLEQVKREKPELYNEQKRKMEEDWTRIQEMSETKPKTIFYTDCPQQAIAISNLYQTCYVNGAYHLVLVINGFVKIIVVFSESEVKQQINQLFKTVKDLCSTRPVAEGVEEQKEFCANCEKLNNYDDMFLSAKDDLPFCEDCVEVRDKRDEEWCQKYSKPKPSNKFKQFFVRIFGFKKEPIFKKKPQPVAEGAIADLYIQGHCNFCNQYGLNFKSECGNLVCNHCLENDNVQMFLCRRCGAVSHNIIKWRFGQYCVDCGNICQNHKCYNNVVGWKDMNRLPMCRECNSKRV